MKVPKSDREAWICLQLEGTALKNHNALENT